MGVFILRTSIQPVNVPDIIDDDFNYILTMVDTHANKESIVQAAGWSGMKDENTSAGSNGYVYTVSSIEGGSIPSGNRALCMEGRAYTDAGQTDYSINYGSEGGSVGDVPANLWIRFNIYIQSDAGSGKLSTFYPTQKFIYPALINYPAGNGEHGWIVGIGSRGNESSDIRASGSPASFPTNEAFLMLSGDVGDGSYGPDNTDSSDYPTNRSKLYQNLNNTVKLTPNTWHTVTLHMDISGTQGIWEAWIGATKVAEWIGGVTPNFTWPTIPGLRGGHRIVKTPTTEPGPGSMSPTADGIGDQWKYFDEWQMATSQSLLRAI